MSFGFTTGLVADLGSSHPAGILALTWLGLGVLCGKAVDRRSVLGDALTAALLCAAASVVAEVLLAIVHACGANVGHALLYAVPAAIGDFVLALAVVPLARRAAAHRTAAGAAPGDHRTSIQGLACLTATPPTGACR